MKPFQIFLSNNGFLINRGVVFGLGNENQENVFVVQNLDGEELFDMTTTGGFEERNYIEHSSSEYLVCIKVFLQNPNEIVEALSTKHDLFVLGNQLTQEVEYNYSPAERFDEIRSSITDTDYVVNVLKDSSDIFFLPKTNWSAKVDYAQLILIDFSEDDADDDVLIQFDFITKDGEDYYKLIPIAHYKNGAMTQFLQSDYFFSFPFWSTTETIELFTSDTE